MHSVARSPCRKDHALDGQEALIDLSYGDLDSPQPDVHAADICFKSPKAVVHVVNAAIDPGNLDRDLGRDQPT